MSDVAIASLSNSDDNAITTQTTFARDDKERHCEVPKARHHIGQWSTLSCHCERPTGASQSHYRRVKKAAFTLAEVLITLAIIGIVAVLTIPTLISDYQERVIITKLKQTYSMLSQAYQFAYNENGSISNQTFGIDMYDENAHAKLANFFKPYLKISKDCVGKSLEYVKENCIGAENSLNEAKYVAAFRLNNGTSLIFRIWNSKCMYSFATGEPDTCGEIIVRTNPLASTYVNGKDSFMFYVTNKGVLPAGRDGDYMTFEDACNPLNKNPYPNFSNGNNMYTCAAWVIFNNNMDYFKCPGELSWKGKHSCKE